MKLLHTTTTTLNTKKFNKLSDKIIESLYSLNSNMLDLYDIHVNYINEEWAIDFLPLADALPAIKLLTYVENNSDGNEILKVSTTDLTNIPKQMQFKDDRKYYELCMNYSAVFEFILALYDFEYPLN